ncbi:protein of unknown function (plasmid) [Cupriavidus taiwanensis]|nr:protein of unknown function [Cupriavidus taiwanensis]
MREIDRLKTVQAVMDGQLRPGVAAERLEITDRQLRRLLERYRLEGPAGLVSRKRGRPSNNRLSGEREAAALGLIREHYATSARPWRPRSCAKHTGSLWRRKRSGG